MLDIMSPLIQEGDALPQEILETILIHLVNPKKVLQYVNPSLMRMFCYLADVM
jgi:hypothetical protein